MRNRFHGLKPGSLLAGLERLLTAIAVAFPDPRTSTLKSPKRRMRALKLAHWKAGTMAGAAVLTMATGVTSVGVEAFAQNQAICLDGTIAGSSCGAPSVGWTGLFKAGTNGDLTYIAAPHQPPNVAGYTGLADFGAPDYMVPDHTYFGSSNKDTQNTSAWQCTTINNPANKQDLQNAYAAVYRRNSDNHRLLYVGSERFDASGDAFQGFWFFQNATSCRNPGASGSTTNFSTAGHVAGDLLILANYTTGGSIAGINLFSWDTSCTGAAGPNPTAGQCGAANLRLIVVESNNPLCGSTAGNAAVACGITNTANQTPPWNVAPGLSQTLVPNTFLELGLDLDNPAISSAVTCGSSFQAETRESQSPTADLKDFVGGQMDLCSPSTTTTSLQKQTNGTWGSLSSGGAVNTGTPVRDTATVSPAPPSADNVTFKLYSGSGCDTSNNPTGSLVTSFGSGGSSTVAYGSGPATSASISNLAPGTYQFQASFGGDVGVQLEGSTSACGSEVFTVQTPTNTTTSLSSSTVSVGDSVSDTATVTGATSAAAGSVAFSVFTDSSCGTLATTGTGGDISAQPTQADFTNNAGTITAHSSSVTFQKAGSYWWEAVYSGDLANFTLGSHSACNSEPLTVNAPALALVKTTTTPTVNAGSTINYTITVSNTTNNATAHGVTVTDTVPTNAGLSWTIDAAHSDAGWTLSGGKLSFGPQDLGPLASSSVTITSPTTVATCGTVANHATATTTNDGSPSSEIVNITVNCPTTTATTLSASSISVGQTASDSATVSGASPSAAGTVSFAVFTNNTCTAAATTGTGGDISAQPTTLTDVNNGDGTISATSSSVTFQKAGTYYWQASYTGDAAHNTSASHSACGTEILNVLAPALSLTKTADHTAAVPAGTPIGFSVTFGNSALAGTGTALGVLLTDPLPNVPSSSTDNFSWAIDGTPTLSSDLVSQGVTCQISPAAATSGQTLSCGTGSNSRGVFTMIPGSSLTVHMTHQTDAASAGTYPNTASVACVNGTACPLSSSATEAVFVAAVAAVLPAQTGDWSIFMLLGAPFILFGLLLLALSRRRREGEA